MILELITVLGKVLVCPNVNAHLVVSVTALYMVNFKLFCLKGALWSMAIN